MGRAQPPLSTGGYIAKHTLVARLPAEVGEGSLSEDPELLTRSA